MPRFINVGMKPADVVQQFDYYNYPVEQLINLVKAKDAQQAKAIDALDTYDDELGKYSSLPGDTQKKQDLINQYTQIKNSTINQDLTGRKGREALHTFKNELRTNVLPKLTKYHESATNFTESYKKEKEKLDKGESTPYTLQHLNDLAQSWDTDKQGAFTPIYRGKYMSINEFQKEFHPKILDGVYSPQDLEGSWRKIISNGAETLYGNTTEKTILPEQIQALFKDYTNYLKKEGFYDDYAHHFNKFSPVIPFLGAAVSKVL
jgi:hypothetical protein